MLPRRDHESVDPVGKLARSVAMAALFAMCASCITEAPPPPKFDEKGRSDSSATSPPVVAEGTDASSAAPDASSAAPADTDAHQATAVADGKQLYARHCAACHGEAGNGRGVAAAFLFPRPRNIATGSFRLVSTKNKVPTRDDLNAVLVRGMPGSAMPPWKHLSQAERDALVDEVLRLHREGVRQQYTNILREAEELTDEELADEDVQKDIQSFVDDQTTPGETSEVPPLPPPTDEAVARGQQHYMKLCQSCHGKDGKGDGVKAMFDEDDVTTTPRDFTRGIFKGGHDPASLYRRIAYGMPGTPMPATSGLTGEQMIDLVYFIRSLSTEEQRQAAELNRETLVVRHVQKLPEQADATSWTHAEPVGLRMTPIWWRNDANPDLTVQAVHDGTTVAVRISWRDETHDTDAVRTESFEDAVALELFRGEAEPFFGMGAATSPLDVWFWDADRQHPLVVEQEYPRVVDDIYPLTESNVETAEFNRPGTKTAGQTEVSLPALASGNPIVPIGDVAAASELTVGGPGSVTFRIPQSRLVSARGEWHDGRWTVVMERTLTVPSDDDGVSLEPGATASVAFAVWNGSARDRDGKKLVTIWQDLKLDP